MRFDSLILMALLSAGLVSASDWSEPVMVTHDDQAVVTYRARWNGEQLVVQATHAPGWHTVAMDNDRRAQEKLAGKKAISTDKPTQIQVSGGLAGSTWYQSPPKDFSKPELRWFTWGFENEALFVTKARTVSKAPAQLTVKGQACSESTCKNIDLDLTVPAPVKAAPVDVTKLVAVP